MMDKQTFLTELARKAEEAGLGRLRGWSLIGVIVLVWLGLIAILLFLLTRVDYRIGRKHLKVTLLGIPVRRVRLDNIRNIHTRRPRFAEKWHNCLIPTYDRILVIEKRHGLIKRLVITPEQRYVFKAELDRAIRAHLGMKPGPTVGDVKPLDMQVAAVPQEENAPLPSAPKADPAT